MNFHVRRKGALLFVAGWTLVLIATGHADVAVKVSIKPLPAEFQALEPQICSHITTAIAEWTRHFVTHDCTLEVVFSIRDWPARGAGRSFVSANFDEQSFEGKHLTEEGAAQILRTGKDPNRAEPDIEIYFDPVYFRTLWFDPDPARRSAPMPPPSEQKLDAFSVILHELGHAFGFNGFRDPKTGKLPDEFLSVYDRWVRFDGSNFFFHGPTAMKLYGKPVPLAHTATNYHHIAEKGETIEAALCSDLMNGIRLEWSHRYDVSALDVAILADCGLQPR